MFVNAYLKSDIYEITHAYMIIEDHRDLNDVLGFSKETLVAVVTNNEAGNGEEWRVSTVNIRGRAVLMMWNAFSVSCMT